MPCPFCKSNYGEILLSGYILCQGCGKISPSASWGKKPVATRKRTNYPEGSHGAKGREKMRVKSSGKTHESEHPIGYKVFVPNIKRNTTHLSKVLEKMAAAYQEEKDSHRKHIGTGKHKNYQGTGVSSDDYREWMRLLVKEVGPSTAIQLSQLFYSHQPEFRTVDPKKQSNLKKGDKSFSHMVENFPPLPFVDKGKLKVKGVSKVDKVEMELSRISARTQKYPSKKKELEVMKKHGVIPSKGFKPKAGIPLTFDSDQYGIPRDGNCLFWAIWECMHALMPSQVGFLSLSDLRRQAVGFLRYDPDIQNLGVINNNYLITMEKDGTWGGELEILALAHLWGVWITVNSPTFPSRTYNQGAHVGFNIYYNGVDHYSTGPLEQKKKKKK